MLKKGINYWRETIGLEASPSSGVREAIQWLMLARLGVLYLLFAGISIQQIFTDQGLVASQLRIAYLLFSAAFFWNLLWSLMIHRLPLRWVFADLQIAFDIFIVSFWIYLSGVTATLFALFYLIEILTVSVIFQQRGAWFAALLSCVMFGLVFLFRPNAEWGGVGVWAGFSAIFLIVGVVGGYLSEELVATTQRLRENQQMIERLTALHERILFNMPTGLITVDRELKVNFINPAGEQILGRPSRDLVGKSLSDIDSGLLAFFNQIDSTEVPDLENSEADFKIESALTGEHHRSYFVQSKSIGGKRRLQQTVEIGLGVDRKLLRGDVAVLDAEAGLGRLLDQQATGGRVLLFQDVTKLMNLEDRLKQNEKLAAVGQLAAGIAHEIRNPLAGMSASIEMLKQVQPSELAQRENQKLMDIALREIDRLNGLISEFLDYVKPDKLKLERVDLKEILHDVVSAASRGKEFQSKVTVNEDGMQSVFASASPEKLKQVIWNLVVNAAQAMPKGGVVTVGCGPATEKRVKFWVADEGTGMSEQTLSHLYEPFFTTKEKGTGLGLATVYKIIEAHQGEIKVDSKLGVGTRFEVFLLSA